jgi:branched-chain amino acid transport system ATP-binding protein
MTLAIEGLSVFYGAVEAVRSASLNVRPKRITTIIGSNGAGKTTIMKAIAGLVPWARGRILFGDVNLATLKSHQVVGAGIALVPEGRRLFLGMSVRENLMIGAFGRNDVASVLRRDLDRVLGHLPALQDRLSEPARALSGGQQQMVAIGRALMSRPQLLMLDEPSIGLSPQMVGRVGEIIRQVAADGVDVLLVEQNATLALGLADDGYVMERGTIVLQGEAAGLKNDAAVKEAYLGL